MSFFSIVIPTYNRANHLPKAIESVLAQSFTDWELIIVDDGSTDNTRELVASYNEPRIKYFYQENAERSAARNNGIRNAKGEWICFLDSDDFFLPNHLHVFSSFVKEHDLQPSFLVSGGYDEENGSFIEKPSYSDLNRIHPAKFILEKTTITTISVCIHKQCFEKHLFIEDFKKSYWEDTHLWIRLVLEFPFYQLPEFTNVLAEHEGRSVNSLITLKRVEDHIGMIDHLFSKYNNLLTNIFSKEDFIQYKNRKYKMFLYQARQNKQLFVSIQIWFKGILNKPSFYLTSEFPKIFINKIGFGIHAK